MKENIRNKKTARSHLAAGLICLVGGDPVTGFQIHTVGKRLAIAVVFQIFLTHTEKVIFLVLQTGKGLAADMGGDHHVAA